MNWLLVTIGGALDWSSWFLGLWTAVVKGGATSASAGISVLIVDPKDFTLGAKKFWYVVGFTFMIGAVTNFMSFLQNNPAPQKLMSQSTKTTTLPSGATSVTTQKTEVTIPTPPPSAPQSDPKP